MVLCIDIGNSNIVLGGFESDKLSFVARISTDASKTSDEYATKIGSILRLHGVEKATVQGAIIASVVPPLKAVMKLVQSSLY